MNTVVAVSTSHMTVHYASANYWHLSIMSRRWNCFAERIVSTVVTVSQCMSGLTEPH